MSKAKQNAITPTNRRRFLRLAASTAAATAFLAAPALAAADPDKRFLAMIGRTRAVVETFIAAEQRAHEAHQVAHADPEMPGYPGVFLDAMREQGSLMADATIEKMRRHRERRVYARHGYDVLADAWNAADDHARAAVERAMAARPNTVAGALAKWQLAQHVNLETNLWEEEEIEETVFPALVADLERLAGKAVRA